MACPYFSGVRTIYDFAKAHGGIAIGMKFETKSARAGMDGEGERTEFTITLPI